MTQGGVSAKVLNQGRHGTCVGYAFSRVMTDCLHEKYGIACDAEKFVEKVKALSVLGGSRDRGHAERVERTARQARGLH